MAPSKTYGKLELIVTGPDGKDVVIPVDSVEVSMSDIEPGNTKPFLIDNTSWVMGGNREEQDKILMRYYDVMAMKQAWQAMREAMEGVGITFEVAGKQAMQFWRAISKDLGMFVAQPRTSGERRYKRLMARQRGLPWEGIKCLR